MPRTQTEIHQELDAAYLRDSELKLGTPEYKANRQAIAVLVGELAPLLPKAGRFTSANYENWPDSFEQMSVNRERRERESARTKQNRKEAA